MGSVAVEVDRAAILEEAATIAASSGEPASAPALEPAPAGDVVAVDVQAKAADVAPAVRMLIAQCSAAFAPNWQIEKAEIDNVGDAAALVMAYWLPDGAIDPKYLALLTLAGSLYAVADRRRLEDGTFKPLRAPRPPASSSASSSTPAPSPAPAGAPLKLV